MTRDYSYDYEWDERYCYPRSDVLKNKLGIMGAETFRAAKREFTSLRIAGAKIEPMKGNFDLKHLQKGTSSVPHNILKRRLMSYFVNSTVKSV